MGVLCPVLGIAVLWDVTLRKIPNPLLAYLFGCGVLFSYAQNGWGGVGRYMGCAGIVIGMLYLFFCIGALGAGDVKLLAAVAGFFGKESVIPFFMISFLIAALEGLALNLLRGRRPDRWRRIASYAAECLRWREILPLPGELSIRGERTIALSVPVLLSAVLKWMGWY
ncbi:MAG: A24 family peptidase [Lachnospiraceae bacterium]|nr:A24 family peptidase [Lachnospiraceae bacterium]